MRHSYYSTNSEESSYDAFTEVFEDFVKTVEDNGWQE